MLKVSKGTDRCSENIKSTKSLTRLCEFCVGLIQDLIKDLMSNAENPKKKQVGGGGGTLIR
jgi:hypothetical protein